MESLNADSVTITLSLEQLDALDWLTYYGIDKMRVAVSMDNKHSGESGMAWGHSVRLDERYRVASKIRDHIHGLAIREGL